ncbi:hypothetical protein PSYMO_10550, partial [Pseudomonas amygdali pv. mori str. 301020]
YRAVALDAFNYRAALRVACRSGRSASGLEYAIAVNAFANRLA